MLQRYRAKLRVGGRANAPDKRTANGNDANNRVNPIERNGIDASAKSARSAASGGSARSASASNESARNRPSRLEEIVRSDNADSTRNSAARK